MEKNNNNRKNEGDLNGKPLEIISFRINYVLLFLNWIEECMASKKRAEVHEEKSIRLRCKFYRIKIKED